MKLVASGSRPILQEQNHIKDTLAKIIVELIKVRYIKYSDGTCGKGHETLSTIL